MSAFWNKKKDDSAQTKQSKAGTEVKKSTKKTEVKAKKTAKQTKSQRKLTAVQAELANRILLRPRISEDTMNKQVEGKYVFEVALDATKNEVAKAIAAVYGVKVVKVNMLRYKKQNKRFRGHLGQTNAFKKAVASLEKGQSIELFKEAK